MSLVEKVEQRINAVRLIQPQDTIIVAVSGGPDSVALLHVLYILSASYQWKLVIAHFNHMFRRDESDEEARFVQKIASNLKLPSEILQFDVPAFIKETNMNAQAAARLKRYEFLHDVAIKYHAQKIALAHHADDQAETIMMRMIRGTSGSGLSGIPERRIEKKVELIRPLLRIYKTEIENFCQENQFNYCVDSSNQKRTYFRNQIRMDVLPFLQSFNRQVNHSLNQLSDILTQEDEYMHIHTLEACKSIVSMHELHAGFSRIKFVQLPVAIQRRLIKWVISQLIMEHDVLDFQALERIRTAIHQTSKTTLQLNVHKHLTFYKEYDDVGFSKLPCTHQDYSYIVHIPQQKLTLIEARMIVQCELHNHYSQDANHFLSNHPNHAAYFDLEQVEFPLEIRNRRWGDRIQPSGLVGTKKVKDLFIDNKIPPSLRGKLPLLIDAKGQLLWIPFVRRSRHAFIQQSTKQILAISFHHSLD